MTTKTSCAYCMINAIILIGLVSCALIILIFAKSTYQTTMDIKNEVHDFVTSPFITVTRWINGKSHVELEDATEYIKDAKAESIKMGKNINSVKDSIIKHADFIQNAVVIQTNGKHIGELQRRDSDEINEHGKEFIKECRRTTLLIHEGASEASFIPEKIERTVKLPGETDVEHRERLNNEIEKFKKFMLRFEETISNSSTQVRRIRDKVSDFCVLLNGKKKIYNEIYKEAQKSKEVMQHLKEYLTSVCSGATVGAGIGAYFAWNPLLAAAASGTGIVVGGAINAGLHYRNSNYKSELKQESEVTLLEIENLSHGLGGIDIYLTEVGKGFHNIRSELSEIQYDLQNLDVSNGHIRFVKLIAATGEKINAIYNDKILKNDVGYKLITDTTNPPSIT